MNLSMILFWILAFTGLVGLFVGSTMFYKHYIRQDNVLKARITHLEKDFEREVQDEFENLSITPSGNSLLQLLMPEKTPVSLSLSDDRNLPQPITSDETEDTVERGVQDKFEDLLRTTLENGFLQPLTLGGISAFLSLPRAMNSPQSNMNSLQSNRILDKIRGMILIELDEQSAQDIQDILEEPRKLKFEFNKDDKKVVTVLPHTWIRIGSNIVRGTYFCRELHKMPSQKTVKHVKSAINGSDDI